MESPSTGEARSKMATEKTGKPPQTLEIVKPRDEAIEYIEDTCKNDYEILSERVESTEIGMSVPIGQPAKVRWLIRYHCGHTAP